MEEAHVGVLILDDGDIKPLAGTCRQSRIEIETNNAPQVARDQKQSNAAFHLA